ncbi:MAG: hypothetical protein P3M75_00300 [Candidatus Hodgkinia cicadicola]|nr:MAG: hypothetical protein P3M75_00300 [Candidatus Hodgkinia cicadicola]
MQHICYRSLCSQKEEGCNHTPFFNSCKPQFYFRTTDATGAIGLQKVFKW